MKNGLYLYSVQRVCVCVCASVQLEYTHLLCMTEQDDVNEKRLNENVKNVLMYIEPMKGIKCDTIHNNTFWSWRSKGEGEGGAGVLRLWKPEKTNKWHRQRCRVSHAMRHRRMNEENENASKTLVDVEMRAPVSFHYYIHRRFGSCRSSVVHRFESAQNVVNCTWLMWTLNASLSVKRIILLVPKQNNGK